MEQTRQLHVTLKHHQMNNSEDTPLSSEAKDNGAIQIDFNDIFPTSQGFSYTINEMEK